MQSITVSVGLCGVSWHEVVGRESTEGIFAFFTPHAQFGGDNKVC